MKLHPVTAFLSLLVLSSVVFAAPPSYSRDNDAELTVYAGATFFNDPELDSVVLVEFPFTLNRHQFEFFRPDTLDSRYFARIYAELILYGVDGQAVDSASTYFSAAVPSREEAGVKGIKLFNSLALLIKPGVYSARVTVIDAVSKARGEFFYEKVIVEPPVRDRLAIGGKCLAYDITPAPKTAASENNRLVKNGLTVLPNPLGIYGVDDTVAYLYAEIYNVQYDPDTPSQLRLAYKVLDDSGRVFSDFGYKTIDKAGTTAVIAESFDISDWPAGRYRLRITATDLLSQQKDSQQVLVTVLEPSTVVASAEVIDEPQPYDTLSLEVQLRLVAYTLTPVEEEALKTLNPVGKKNFLKQYWREHDSDPKTAVNETLIEAVERYEYANYNFSTNAEKTNGWKTDRGRIYMTYGPWEERDDIEAPRVGNPFVIWWYHSIREGSVFVFEDLQGFRDYTLVHSNVEGERYSQEWEDILRDQRYNWY